MRQSLKIAISLLASLLLFAGFAVVAFSGLFNVLQASFFVPRIEKVYQNELELAAGTINTFHEGNLESFRSVAQKAFISASFATTLDDATIKAWGETSAQLGVPFRLIGADGKKILYSTLETDVAEAAANRKIYKNYNVDNSAIPWSELAAPADNPLVLNDRPRGQFVYVVPVTAGASAGTLVFYVSQRTLLARLAKTSELAADSLTLVGKNGVVIGFLPPGAEETLSAIWTAGSGHYFTAPLILAGTSISYRVFSVLLSRGGYASLVEPSKNFEMTAFMQGLLLGTFLLTVFLLIYLVFNLRSDPLEVLRQRVKRFQVQLITELVESPGGADWGKWRRELEVRKDEITWHIQRGIGRVSRKKKPVIDEYMTKSWGEILDLISRRVETPPAPAIGAMDFGRLETLIKTALQNVNLAAPAQVAASPKAAAGAKPAAAAAAAGAPAAPPRPVQVQSVAAGEAEELEEAEAVEEAEGVEEAEPAEAAEAAEAAGEAEELEEAEAVEEAEPAEAAESVEASAEAEELEEAEAVEEAEGVEEAEPAEAAEAAEAAGEAEELEEAEAVEEAEGVEEAEPAEAAEAVEASAEAEELEEAEAAEGETFIEASAIEDDFPETLIEYGQPPADGAPVEIPEAEVFAEAEPASPPAAISQVEAVAGEEMADEAEPVEDAELIEDAEFIDGADLVEDEVPGEDADTDLLLIAKDSRGASGTGTLGVMDEAAAAPRTSETPAGVSAPRKRASRQASGRGLLKTAMSSRSTRLRPADFVEIRIPHGGAARHAAETASGASELEEGPAGEDLEELVPLFQIQPLPPLPVEEGLEMLPPAEEVKEESEISPMTASDDYRSPVPPSEYEPEEPVGSGDSEEGHFLPRTPDFTELEELEAIEEEPGAQNATGAAAVSGGEQESELAALVGEGKVAAWTIEELGTLVEEASSAIVMENGVYRIKDEVYASADHGAEGRAESEFRELAKDVVANTGKASGSAARAPEGNEGPGSIGDLLRDEDTLDLSTDVSFDKGLSAEESLTTDGEKSNPIRLKRNGLDYDEFLSSYPRSFTHTTQMKSLVEVSRRVSAVSAGLFLKKVDGLVPDLTIGLSEKSVKTCTFAPRDPLSSAFLLSRKAVAIDRSVSEIRFLSQRFDQEDVRYMKRVLFIPATFRSQEAYLLLSFSSETDISISDILSKLIVR